MARLLSQMNREIELGNYIDLNLLLTGLENIFQQQDDTADDKSRLDDNNTLQEALVASVSRVLQPQHRIELKA